MASIEFKENINWKRRLKLSRHSRRVGVLSLTVYSFASLQALLRVLLDLIFPSAGFRIAFGLNIWWTLFLIAIEAGMWVLIMWLWEKAQYIGSLDWLFAIILKGVKTKKYPGRRAIFGDLLDIRNKVIEPYPMSWVGASPAQLEEEKTVVMGEGSEESEITP